MDDDLNESHCKSINASHCTKNNDKITCTACEPGYVIPSSATSGLCTECGEGYGKVDDKCVASEITKKSTHSKTQTHTNAHVHTHAQAFEIEL